MRKMKALFLTLALGFTFAAAATAVACNKDDGAPANSSSDWFGGEEESLVSLRFDNSYMKTYQYETLTLGYKVSGTASKVEFSSSDEALATVDDNGVVTTKDGIGKVTITASVEGISATCELDIEKSPYAPEIVLNETEYTMEAGDTLAFTIKTEWNKAEMAEDIEYAVSFAENSQNATAQISVEGNTVKVVSGVAETFDVVISTTVRGIYTSKAVTVEVKETVLSIQAMNTELKPAVGKYTATISTTDKVGDMANSVDLSFAAVKGGKVIDGASITWDVDGDAAVIEGEKLVGKKRGTVTLTGTVEHEGETATVKLACDVIPPEVHLEQTYTLEVENIKNTTLKVSEKLIGKLQNAELFGEVVSSQVVAGPQLIKFKFDQGAIDAGKRNPYFPMSASQLGAQQLVINTDQVRYTMDVDIYTMIINDASELDKMSDLAYTGQTELNERYNQVKSSEYYDGYFILGNDIDYNKTIKSMTDTGMVWWCQGNTYDLTRGFQGVFDGMGYNIDGVTVGNNPSGSNQSGGIFGYLAKTGIVKNVSFTNATLQANNGFICSAGDGTIENVSISYKKLGGDKTTEGLNSSSPRLMGSFFTQKAGSNATVKNCLIDASAADITVEEGWYSGKKSIPIKLAGAAENVENVIVLCPNQTLLAQAGADITRLTYNEVIAEGGLISNFDKSIWTTVDNIPMFINQANNLDRDAAVEFLNLDSVLVAGFEMLVVTNNPYVKIEVEEVAGVKFESSILTATNEAFTQEVTLTATSLLNPTITATHTVYIDSFGKNVAAPTVAEAPVVYNSNPVLSIGDNSWKGEKNYVYLGAHIIGESEGTADLTVDWQKLGWGESEVTVVSVKNGEREHFVIDVEVDYTKAKFEDGEMVLDSAFSDRRTFGEYTLTDVESDIEAPEGYENVERLDCKQAWSTALSAGFWSPDSMNEYSDIWFAMKIVNGRWVMQEVTVSEAASNWVEFHYTQTSDGVWAVEVTVAGNHYKTVHDIAESKLQNLLYRGGWATGFLLYNNQQGEEKDENGKPMLPFTTSVYATEVRGVKKA